jgi:hypothetical protein
VQSINISASAAPGAAVYTGAMEVQRVN